LAKRIRSKRLQGTNMTVSTTTRRASLSGMRKAAVRRIKRRTTCLRMRRAAKTFKTSS
jgi:predicted secreted protein